MELPRADFQRGWEMANGRLRCSSRLRRHESSPPAMQAVWNRPVGFRSTSTDCHSVPAWVSSAVRRGVTAAAQQQQHEDVARQPMLECKDRLQTTLRRSRIAQQRTPCRSQPWDTAREHASAGQGSEEPPDALTRVAGFTTLPVHPLQ